MHQLIKFAPRITLLISLVVGVAIGPVANVSAQDRSGELQLIVNQLNQQLKLVSRFDVRRSQARYEALADAIELWDASPRGDAEFAVMEEWLQQALRASMPGSTAAMPAAPDFSTIVAEVLPDPAVAVSDGDAEAQEVAATGGATSDRVSPPSESNVAETPDKTLATAPNNATQAPAPASPWDNHPATRPIRIEAADPFVDDPVVDGPFVDGPVVASTREPNPRSIAANRPEPRVAKRPTTFVSRESQPEVNLAELAARTSGYERGLQQIESKLIVESEMESADLLILAREVSELANQHEFIVLYIKSLGDNQRDLILQPMPVDKVKNLLAKQIRSRQQTGSAPDDVFLPARDEALEAASELLESI